MCLLVFGIIVKLNLPDSWTPTYKDRNGSPFVIFDAGTAECPVSLIAMEDKQPHRGLTSFETVMLYSRTRTMYEAFGVTPYGGNSTRG